MIGLDFLKKGNIEGIYSTKLKVLTFFGSDLKGPGFLQKKFSEGYVLLALDVSAIGLALKAGVSYTVIDDWIDANSMQVVVEKALHCELHWFESARKEFTVGGICWPHFDGEAMHWFWLNVALASTFEEAFRTRGGQDLEFFQHAVRRPAVYYYPSDVCGPLWKADLGDKAKPFVLLGKSFWYRALRYALSKIRKIPRLTRRYRRDLVITHPSVLAGKVVLAFNPGEFHRFTPIIKQLLDGFPGKVVAAILSPDQATADEIAAKWSIPVVCEPSLAPVDPGLQKRFLHGYVKALDAAGGQLWQKPLEYLDFHFEYYCKQRWPALVADFRFWFGVLKQWRPKAIIVSSLSDAESQLPAEAAKRLNIPTFSIPHGGVMREHETVSEYVLYSLNTQKITHERAGMSVDRLLPCAGLFAKNEYPVSPLQLGPNKSKWRVLVVTSGIGFRGCLIPNIGPRAQLTALHALNNPPSDLAEKVQLFIKVHPNPNYSDLELFGVVGTRLKEHVLPASSDLHSVIEYFDLVVSVNNTGSALIHILRAEKPVIHFWTNYQPARTDAYCDIFLSSGMIARTSDELWKLVGGYFTDPDLAKEMRLKVQEFHRDNLDDRNYPQISEVISEVLSKRSHLK